jgi:hypothetical protein
LNFDQVIPLRVTTTGGSQLDVGKRVTCVSGDANTVHVGTMEGADGHFGYRISQRHL